MGDNAPWGMDDAVSRHPGADVAWFGLISSDASPGFTLSIADHLVIRCWWV